MRTSILTSIITIIIIQTIRLRVVRSFFHKQSNRSLQTIHIYFRGAIIVGSLLVYKYISGHRGQSLSENSRTSIGIFTIYCGLIVSIIYMARERKSSYYAQLLIVTLCLSIMVNAVAFFMPMQTIISYVLISVYAEEYLKIHGSSGLVHNQTHKQYTGRDLIFFALLIGLGFSFIEHITYIINYYITGETVMRGIHIARGLLTTVIHIVSSGMIAYMALRRAGTKKQYRIGTVIGTTVAVILHMTYNLSIHFQRTILTIIIGIASYYLLTFLLYQTNILYEKSSKK